MSIQLVGSVGPISVGAVGASVTPAWGAGSSQTKGNLLICWIAEFGQTSIPETTFPFPPWGTAHGGGFGNTGVWIVAANARGGDSAPTIPAATGVSFVAQLAEFSGVEFHNNYYDQEGGTAGNQNFLRMFMAPDSDVGDLVTYAGSALYTVAATATLTHVLSNGVVNHDVNNNSISTTNHYAFGYGYTTSIGDGEEETFTCPTTNISGNAIEVVTFQKNPSSDSPPLQNSQMFARA